MNFLTDNLAIISKRWPNIAEKLNLAYYCIEQVELIEDKQLSLVFDKIQIASSYDQVVEAKIQLDHLNNDTQLVAIYGTGLGEVQRQLLHKSNLKELEIIVFNFPLFKACLTYFNQQDWLLNKRVTLKIATDDSKVRQNFIALPAELVLAENFSARLRDKVCLTLDNDFINNKGINNAKLQKSIKDNLSFIKSDFDVSKLFSSMNNNNNKNNKFIICAAGPTLLDHFSWLQKPSTRDSFTVIAVDAAVMPLAEAGVIPDIVVSIDPVAKKLLDCLNIKDFKHVPLVYFPVVNNELLSFWQGPRYVAYSTGDLYQSINKDYPRGRLYCAGSVIHPAIDLSVKIGAKQVLFLGADFSFPEGKSHTFWQLSELANKPQLSTTNTPHWVLNGFNERVPTLLNYRGYLRDLEDYIIVKKQVEFFNGSKKGAFIKGTKQWKENSEAIL